MQQWSLDSFRLRCATHLFVRILLVNGPFYREYIWHILNYTHIFFDNLYFATGRVYNQPSHVVTICVLIWRMLVARWMPASWTFRTTVSTRSSTRRGCMVHLDRQSSRIVFVVMFFQRPDIPKWTCLGCLAINWWSKQKLPSFHIAFANQTSKATFDTLVCSSRPNVSAQAQQKAAVVHMGYGCCIPDAEEMENWGYIKIHKA